MQIHKLGIRSARCRFAFAHQSQTQPTIIPKEVVNKRCPSTKFSPKEFRKTNTISMIHILIMNPFQKARFLNIYTLRPALPDDFEHDIKPGPMG